MLQHFSLELQKASPILCHMQKDTTIRIRIRQADKDAAEAVAKARGQDLSKMLRAHIERMIKRHPAQSEATQ